MTTTDPSGYVAADAARVKDDPFASERQPFAARCAMCGDSALKAFTLDEAPSLGTTYVCVHCVPEMTRIACENAPEILDTLRKPKRELAQFDGWINIEPGDYVMVPDEHGDVCTGGRVRDRQRLGTTVRILVDPHADHTAVARLLDRLAEWVRSGERFDECQRPTPDQYYA